MRVKKTSALLLTRDETACSAHNPIAGFFNQSLDLVRSAEIVLGKAV